jgi:hypothetical protein
MSDAKIYPRDIHAKPGDTFEVVVPGFDPAMTVSWYITGAPDTEIYAIEQNQQNKAKVKISPLEKGGDLDVICSQKGVDGKVITAQAVVYVHGRASASATSNTDIWTRFGHQGNWKAFIPAPLCMLAGWLSMFVLSAFTAERMQTSKLLVELFPTSELVEEASALGYWLKPAPGAFMVGMVAVTVFLLVSAFSWNRKENAREDADGQNYHIGRFVVPFMHNVMCGGFVVLVWGLSWAARVGDGLIFEYFGGNPIIQAVIIIAVAALVIMAIRKIWSFGRKFKD